MLLNYRTHMMKTGRWNILSWKEPIGIIEPQYNGIVGNICSAHLFLKQMIDHVTDHL